MDRLAPEPLEPLPAQVVLAVPADVKIDQAVAGLQPEPFPELVAAVVARGHDHADIDDGGHVGHPQRGLGPEQRGRLAIGLAELGDQAERLAADPPGMRGIDIGPGEVGQQEPGDPRPPRGHQRDGRRVAEDGRGPLVAELLRLVIDPRHRLGMHLGRQGQGRRAVGRVAVARRIRAPRRP